MKKKFILLSPLLRFYMWVGLAYCGLLILAGLSKSPDPLVVDTLNQFWLTLFLTPVNYVLFEITFALLQWRKIHYFLLLLIAHFVLYPFVFYLWQQVGILLHIYTPTTSHTLWKWLEILMSYAVGSIVFFGVCKHIYNYLNLKRATMQLKIEKQEAELNYLKSQTNPHFLFNTLNNIHSLAREKSDHTPESILRLSEILRYMLYETSGSFVAIEKEVKTMADYIALEKLRYDQTVRISFHHDIEDMKQPVPPLLLMPLVENAFKHGVSETLTNPFAEVNLSLKKGILSLVVINSSENMQPQRKENIGLSNLKRQLELLFADYDLTTTHSDQTFTASLTINLGSHV